MSETPFEALSDDDRARLRQAPFPHQDQAAMAATLTEARFSDPSWIFERKWDGVRCLARRDHQGDVRLLSRNGQDMTRTYPEITVALADQADTDLVVDGEVVAFDGRRTSFETLQGRLGITDPDVALASGIRVFLYVFDVLHLAGHDTRVLPLTARKKLLRAALTFSDPSRYTAHRVGAGEAAYREACERGDEGVIAKRAASPYSGGRSKDWLKFKCVRDQELVIGGWTPPKGSRTDFGALLVGYYDGTQLRYAGKVGTGFSGDVLRRLGAQLRDDEVVESPFSARVRETGARWVRPRLVAQIGFTEWTRDGMLRHPRFQGLRGDKDARDVVREQR